MVTTLFGVTIVVFIGFITPGLLCLTFFDLFRSPMTSMDELIVDSEEVGRLLLRAQIDELQSQIQHLSRSNEELQLALQETPDDEDFLLALEENVVVIEKKQEAIAMKEEELYRLDIAFRQEKAATLRGLDHSHMIASLTLSPSPTAIPIPIAIPIPPASSISTVSDTNSSPTVLPAVGGVTTTESADDGGLYL